MEEHGAPILQQDRDGDEKADRGKEQKPPGGADDIEDPPGPHDLGKSIIKALFIVKCNAWRTTPAGSA
jgi:hypothetical protein